jgi:hypothetical protein
MVMRPSSAVVILASPKTLGHSPEANWWRALVKPAEQAQPHGNRLVLAARAMFAGWLEKLHVTNWPEAAVEESFGMHWVISVPDYPYRY